jgi:hypothetical protein
MFPPRVPYWRSVVPALQRVVSIVTGRAIGIVTGRPEIGAPRLAVRELNRIPVKSDFARTDRPARIIPERFRTMRWIPPWKGV